MMLPWKDIYAALSRVFTLTQEMQKNKSDTKSATEEVARLSSEVKSLNQKMSELALAFQRIFYETQRLHDEMRHVREDNGRRDRDAARERELFMLRLEVQIMKFERRLPPPKPEDEAED